MFLVGLTGGIASGKSTVAEFWQSVGAEIIDADNLAREVVAPGTTGLAEIVETFGESMLAPDGSLDRQALASNVFHSVEARRNLEEITHPKIRDLAESRIESSSSEIIVYVIPLLVESKSQLPFDFVVTVEAPENDQVQRMTMNRDMSEVDARARIAAQATPAQRANISDRILNSNQSLALLLNDAKVLWREIELLAAKKAATNVT
jgi:dephospho-CoA kinase